MSIGGNSSDVVVSFQLSEGFGSSSWDFSLKETLTSLEWDDEDKRDLLEGLLALAEFVWKQIGRATEQQLQERPGL
jgi:hypothetical protein